ncbi:MAG: hypothetical protein ACYSP9_04420, partial [Planctomycetota bacterium]
MAKSDCLMGSKRGCPTSRIPARISSNSRTKTLRGVLVLAVALVTVAVGRAEAVNSTEVKALFADPPRQYSSGPLWVWHDMLTDEQIVGTLRDLAGQDVKQVFVHPRPGLMTPYLSNE